MGSTTVSFAVSSDGSLLSVTVSQSSGKASLDQAALAAVRAAAPFPPPPAGAGPADLVFSLAFDYH
jgi:protein TonB